MDIFKGKTHEVQIDIFYKIYVNANPIYRAMQIFMPFCQTGDPDKREILK